MAKTIGIFLVIWGHGGLSQGCVNDFIFSFHMPLFFFLSGILYKWRPIAESIKKDTKRLIVPYLIISATLLVYNISVGAINHTITIERVVSCLGAIAIGVGYNTPHLTPVSTPCWFIIAIFIIRQAYAIIGTGKKPLALSIFIPPIIVFLLTKHQIHTYIPLDSALMGMPFFALGIICKKKEYIHATHMHPTSILSLAVVGVTLGYYNGHVDTNTLHYGSSIFLYYVVGLTLSLSLMECCKYYKRVGG